MDKHDAPADALGFVAEATEKVADMLPLDMVADLVDPGSRPLRVRIASPSQVRRSCDQIEICGS